MKRHLLFLIGLIMSTSVLAQAPSTFSFQAVIRDSNNLVISNSPVGMRTTILQGSENGVIVYQEIYHPNPVTNINGLVTLVIGNGLALAGNFENIEWSDGPYFIKTEADPAGGTNYTITGTTRLMSVPYALHAVTADNLSFDIIETDPVFAASAASEIETADLEHWDEAYNWGDHSLQGYLTQETDPLFAVSPAAGIDAVDIESWDEAHGWGNHAEAGYLTEETQTLAEVLAEGNDANSMQIKNLAMPANDHDAATKHYVDLYWEEFKGSEPGEMKYWDGEQWVELVPGDYGQSLIFCDGVPTWGGCLPVVTTSEIEDLLLPVIGGGNVLSDGGSHVTQRGVCWSTAENPTIDENEGFSIDGTGMGEFTSTLSGLSFSTVYYVRAYAINSVGISYGEQIEFVTSDCGQPITFYYRGQEVTYGTIERGGLCWMDRNLGASRVPISMTDSQGYGDTFQWGRLDDGHQDRSSSTTTTLSNTDVPGHNKFIRRSSSPYDWRSPKNDDLWQGEDGINNPCPPGWRIPTEAELNAERQSWGSNNSAGAYASTLKWPVGGIRRYDGVLVLVDSYGYVYSSTVDGTSCRNLRYEIDGSNMYTYWGRAYGVSVRCVRDN